MCERCDQAIGEAEAIYAGRPMGNLRSFIRRMFHGRALLSASQYEFPPGFEWSDEEQRPVYKASRGGDQ